MAKNKKPLPRDMQPLPTTRTEESARAIQDWLDFGGGKAAGKGRATISGADPRNIASEPELVGWDEHDMPIFKEGPQVGKPEIVTGHTGEPGDTSLIDIPELHSPEAFHPEPVEGKWTLPITPEQLNQMLEGLYGNRGGIRNFRPVGELPRGPLINLPLGGLPGGPLINRPLGVRPQGPLINTDLGASPPGGFKEGYTLMPNRSALLAALAANQAKAHGHHLFVA